MERQHTHPPQGAKTGLLPQDPTVCPTQRPADTTPEEAVPVGDLSKPVVVVKLSAPPTTHYRRRRKISQPSDPTLFAGTGENGAP